MIPTCVNVLHIALLYNYSFYTEGAGGLQCFWELLSINLSFTLTNMQSSVSIGLGLGFSKM